MDVNQDLSDKQFVVNLINGCIGVGILSMPFAFSIAQFYSIICMLMAVILNTYGAYCITKVTLCAYGIDSSISFKPIATTPNDSVSDIETFADTEIRPTQQNIKAATGETANNENPAAVKIEENTSITSGRSVYTVISYKALGKFGAVYTTIGLIFLLTIFLVNILVMNWKLLTGIFHTFNKNYNASLIYLYVILLVLPLIFVLKWKELTIMAWISVLAITITAIIIFYLFVKAQIDFDAAAVPSLYFDGIDEINTSGYALDNMNTISLIFLAFLMYINGLSGNATLVMMVISLENKKMKHIIKLICISYAIVASFYCFIGIIGQHIYGSSTHVLVLNNLFYWPLNDIIAVLISIIMIINLFASFAIFCGVDADVIEGILRIKSDERYKRILLRLVLLILSGAIGFCARNNLALLTAIQSCVGALCGSILTVPIALYLAMFWHQISFFSKMLHILLLFCVIGIAIWVAIQSMIRLL